MDNINKNSDKRLLEIYEIISKLNSAKEVESFMNELFTPSEINDIIQRWNILKLLSENQTQRSVSEALSVSLCNVTRGAKVLKNEKSIMRQILFDESWRN